MCLFRFFSKLNCCCLPVVMSFSDRRPLVRLDPTLRNRIRLMIRLLKLKPFPLATVRILRRPL